MGRPRTPSAIHRARGKLAKDGKTVKTLGGRELPSDEPQPEVAATNVEPPFGITKRALKHWAGTVKVLTEAKVLTVMDTAALRVFCEAYGAYQEAVKQLDDVFGELVYTTHTGFLAVRPEWEVHNKAMDQMVKLLKEFGMTPASRASIKAAPGKAGGEAPQKGGKFGRIAQRARGEP